MGVVRRLGTGWGALLVVGVVAVPAFGALASSDGVEKTSTQNRPSLQWLTSQGSEAVPNGNLIIPTAGRSLLRNRSANSSGFRLPWQFGVAHTVIQGWGGSYSHQCPGQSCYAYDFDLVEGTPVLAAQQGTVAFAEGGFTACGGYELRNKANRVVLNHPDGTATLYLHLKSVSVKIGDPVSQGQLIGYSGKTGWTYNPGVGCLAHLHFARQAQGSWINNSRPVYFDESPGAQLVQGHSYVSQNSPPITRAQADAFLVSVYRDVLQRPLDSAGEAYWSQLLMSGTSRTEVVRRILTSNEAIYREIYGFYRTYLHRRDSGAGISGWLRNFRAGNFWEQIKSGFFGSLEYFLARANNNDGWLDSVYVDVLHRLPDLGGRAVWKGQLARGVSRQAVAARILASKEAYTDLVSDWYLAYLHRSVDQAGLSSNVAILLSGAARDEQVLANLLGSGEYFANAQKGIGAISTTAWYSIVNRYSGKCVDAKYAETKNGTVIQQYHCDPTFAQQFQFQPTSDGYYRVVNRNAGNPVWDVNGISVADGGRVTLWSWNGGGNQQWLPVPRGGGYYDFRARHSGKCLDVTDTSIKDWVPLQQYHCYPTPAESFSLSPH